jgi:H+/Cl- antiporter ClcA/CBS domain-containing protein
VRLPFRRWAQNVSTQVNRTGKLELGDFTANKRIIFLSVAGIVLGVVGAFVALGLLRLIALFTNIFFFQRWTTAWVSPAENHLGVWELAVPVVGALIVGLMARYGSERIRGHGIPEAIEAILIQGSRVEPRLALLKPLSSAISIGSGGPFGAEGPIIMTGGAFGSLMAQFMRLSSAERKTLLVAGAAAGMSATFASPVAAILLAVELLLFEWKPRSFVPVALSSITAAVVRRYIMGPGPLFPVPAHPLWIGMHAIFACLLVGLMAGVLSALLTFSVYAAEDGFRKLPMHWMWWPALGGLVVGAGGLILPQALGVGYDIIGKLVAGTLPGGLLIGILLVKWIIWAVSLGSGTSGGVLAPLLMMGGALGGLEALFLPGEGTGFWPLVSMGAVLGGTMRSPFTGIIFVLELTHEMNVLLPLSIAVTVAHGFTVLSMRRSILTEKVSRRGYHLTREYAVDPLEVLFVREVMRTKIAALPATMLVRDLAKLFASAPRSQHLFPVTDSSGYLSGALTGADVQKHIEEQALKATADRVQDVARRDLAKAYPDEPLTYVVSRMAETGLTAFPVVEREHPRKLLGLISLNDLLVARVRRLQEEQRRERVLPLRLAFPLGSRWQRHRQTQTAQSSQREEPAPEDESGHHSNWTRVRNPDCWNGRNGGFNASNAKMICQRCHQEFPFDLRCSNCGSSSLVLDTAAETPGIFCTLCHEGQWHWDCPSCRRRQDFSTAFYYDKNAIAMYAS